MADDSEGGLKGLYYSLEDKYYNFLNSVQDAGVPAYDFFVKPIEGAGIPSMPVAIVLAILIIGAIGYAALNFTGASTQSIEVSVLSNGEFVDGARVAMLVDGATQEVKLSSEDGKVVFEVPKGKTVSFVVKKDGFEDSTADLTEGSSSLSVLLSPRGSTIGFENKIKVIVLNDQTMAPLGGATIYFNDGGLEKTILSKSDGTATFSFTSDTVDISVTAEGFDENQVQNAASGEYQVRLAPVAAARDNGGGSPVAKKSTISVTLVDSDLNPVEGSVELYESGRNTPLQTSRTSGGMAIFEEVVVNKLVYAKAYPEDPSFEKKTSDSIEVSEDESENYIEVELSKKAFVTTNGLLQVIVVDEKNEPLEDVELSLYSRNRPSDVIERAQTDSDGLASFDVDKLTSWQVVGFLQDYLPNGIPVALGVQNKLLLTKIKTGNNGFVNVSVVNYLNKPVEGATVSLRNNADSVFLGIPEATTDEQGFAYFAGVPLNKEIYAIAFTDSRNASSGSVKLINPSQSVRLDVIVPKPRGTIIFNVVNPLTDKGLNNTVITVGSSESKTCTTNAEGVCSIEKVEAEVNLQISVSAPSFMEFTESRKISSGESLALTYKNELIPQDVADSNIFKVNIRNSDQVLLNPSETLVGGEVYYVDLIISRPIDVNSSSYLFRVGDDLTASSDFISIIGFQKPSDLGIDSKKLTVTAGASFDSLPGFSCDSSNTDRVREGLTKVKWVNYDFLDRKGTQVIHLVVFVDPKAKEGAKASFYFAATTEKNNKYYHLPTDDVLGLDKTNLQRDYCQADTNSVSYFIGIGTSAFSGQIGLATGFSKPLLTSTKTTSLSASVGENFFIHYQARSFQRLESPSLKFFVSDRSGAHKNLVNFSTASITSYNEEMQDFSDTSEPELLFDATLVEKDPITLLYQASGWLNASAFAKTNSRLVPEVWLNAVFTEGNSQVSSKTKMKFYGDALLSLTADKSYLNANEDVALTVTVSTSSGGKQVAVTDTILCLKQDSGIGAQKVFGDSYDDCSTQVIGDGRSGSGANGNYVFRIRPLRAGKFFVYAGSTKDPRFSESILEIEVDQSDFLVLSGPEEVDVGCSGALFSLTNSLDYISLSDVLLTVGPGCSINVPTRDFTCTEGIEGVSCSSYKLSSSLASGATKSFRVEPVRNGECDLTASSLLSVFAYSESSKRLKVSCPDKQLSATLSITGDNLKSMPGQGSVPGDDYILKGDLDNTVHLKAVVSNLPFSIADDTNAKIVLDCGRGVNKSIFNDFAQRMDEEGNAVYEFDCDYSNTLDTAVTYDISVGLNQSASVGTKFTTLAEKNLLYLVPGVQSCVISDGVLTDLGNNYVKQSFEVTLNNLPTDSVSAFYSCDTVETPMDSDLLDNNYPLVVTSENPSATQLKGSFYCVYEKSVDGVSASVGSKLLSATCTKTVAVMQPQPKCSVSTMPTTSLSDQQVQADYAIAFDNIPSSAQAVSYSCSEYDSSVPTQIDPTKDGSQQVTCVYDKSFRNQTVNLKVFGSVGATQLSCESGDVFIPMLEGNPQCNVSLNNEMELNKDKTIFGGYSANAVVQVDLPSSIKSRATVKLACTSAKSDSLQTINPVDGVYSRDCSYVEKLVGVYYSPNVSVIVPGETINDLNLVFCNSPATADIATAFVQPTPTCEITEASKTEPTATTPFIVGYAVSCKNLNKDNLGLHDLKFTCSDSITAKAISGEFDSNNLFTSTQVCEYPVNSQPTASLSYSFNQLDSFGEIQSITKTASLRAPASRRSGVICDISAKTEDGLYVGSGTTYAVGAQTARFYIEADVNGLSACDSSIVQARFDCGDAIARDYRLDAILSSPDGKTCVATTTMPCDYSLASLNHKSVAQITPAIVLDGVSCSSSFSLSLKSSSFNAQGLLSADRETNFDGSESISLISTWSNLPPGWLSLNPRVRFDCGNSIKRSNIERADDTTGTAYSTCSYPPVSSSKNREIKAFLEMDSVDGMAAQESFIFTQVPPTKPAVATEDLQEGECNDFMTSGAIITFLGYFNKYYAEAQNSALAEFAVGDNKKGLVTFDQTGNFLSLSQDLQTNRGIMLHPSALIPTDAYVVTVYSQYAKGYPTTLTSIVGTDAQCFVKTDDVNTGIKGAKTILVSLNPSCVKYAYKEGVASIELTRDGGKTTVDHLEAALKIGGTTSSTSNSIPIYAELVDSTSSSEYALLISPEKGSKIVSRIANSKEPIFASLNVNPYLASLRVVEGSSDLPNGVRNLNPYTGISNLQILSGGKSSTKTPSDEIILDYKLSPESELTKDCNGYRCFLPVLGFDVIGNLDASTCTKTGFCTDSKDYLEQVKDGLTAEWTSVLATLNTAGVNPVFSDNAKTRALSQSLQETFKYLGYSQLYNDCGKNGFLDATSLAQAMCYSAFGQQFKGFGNIFMGSDMSGVFGGAGAIYVCSQPNVQAMLGPYAFPNQFTQSQGLYNSNAVSPLFGGSPLINMGSSTPEQVKATPLSLPSRYANAGGSGGVAGGKQTYQLTLIPNAGVAPVITVPYREGGDKGGVKKAEFMLNFDGTVTQKDVSVEKPLPYLLIPEEGEEPILKTKIGFGSVNKLNFSSKDVAKNDLLSLFTKTSVIPVLNLDDAGKSLNKFYSCSVNYDEVNSVDATSLCANSPSDFIKQSSEENSFADKTGVKLVLKSTTKGAELGAILFVSRKDDKEFNSDSTITEEIQKDELKQLKEVAQEVLKYAFNETYVSEKLKTKEALCSITINSKKKQIRLLLDDVVICEGEQVTGNVPVSPIVEEAEKPSSSVIYGAGVSYLKVKNNRCSSGEYLKDNNALKLDFTSTGFLSNDVCLRVFLSEDTSHTLTNGSKIPVLIGFKDDASASNYLFSGKKIIKKYTGGAYYVEVDKDEINSYLVFKPLKIPEGFPASGSYQLNAFSLEKSSSGKISANPDTAQWPVIFDSSNVVPGLVAPSPSFAPAESAGAGGKPIVHLDAKFPIPAFVDSSIDLTATATSSKGSINNIKIYSLFGTGSRSLIKDCSASQVPCQIVYTPKYGKGQYVFEAVATDSLKNSNEAKTNSIEVKEKPVAVVQEPVSSGDNPTSINAYIDEIPIDSNPKTPPIVFHAKVSDDDGLKTIRIFCKLPSKSNYEPVGGCDYKSGEKSVECIGNLNSITKTEFEKGSVKWYVYTSDVKSNQINSNPPDSEEKGLKSFSLAASTSTSTTPIATPSTTVEPVVTSDSPQTSAVSSESGIFDLSVDPATIYLDEKISVNGVQLPFDPKQVVFRATVRNPGYGFSNVKFYFKGAGQSQHKVFYESVASNTAEKSYRVYGQSNKLVASDFVPGTAYWYVTADMNINGNTVKKTSAMQTIIIYETKPAGSGVVAPSSTDQSISSSDTSSPSGISIAFAKSDADYYVGSKVALRAKATDASGIKKFEFYYVTGGTPTFIDRHTVDSPVAGESISNPIDFTPDKTGIYYIRVVVYDALGNLATKTSTASFQVKEKPVSSTPSSDTSGPEITSLIVQPTSSKGYVVPLPIQIMVKAKDASGVGRIDYSYLLNGAEIDDLWNSYTPNAEQIVANQEVEHFNTFYPTKAGSYHIKVVATDKNGNISPPKLSEEFTVKPQDETTSSAQAVDSVEPSIESIVASPTAGVVVGENSVTVKAVASDNTAVTKIKLYFTLHVGSVLIDECDQSNGLLTPLGNPSTQFTKASCELQFDPLTDGVYTFKAVAYDASNNANNLNAADVKTVQVTVNPSEAAIAQAAATDTEAPSISFVQPSNAEEGSAFTVSFNAVDLKPIAVSNGGTKGTVKKIDVQYGLQGQSSKSADCITLPNPDNDGSFTCQLTVPAYDSKAGTMVFHASAYDDAPTPNIATKDFSLSIQAIAQPVDPSISRLHSTDVAHSDIQSNGFYEVTTFKQGERICLVAVASITGPASNTYLSSTQFVLKYPSGAKTEVGRNLFTPQEKQSTTAVHCISPGSGLNNQLAVGEYSFEINVVWLQNGKAFDYTSDSQATFSVISPSLPATIGENQPCTGSYNEHFNPRIKAIGISLNKGSCSFTGSDSITISSKNDLYDLCAVVFLESNQDLEKNCFTLYPHLHITSGSNDFGLVNAHSAANYYPDAPTVYKQNYPEGPEVKNIKKYGDNQYYIVLTPGMFYIAEDENKFINGEAYDVHMDFYQSTQYSTVLGLHYSLAPKITVSKTTASNPITPASSSLNRLSASKAANRIIFSTSDGLYINPTCDLSGSGKSSSTHFISQGFANNCLSLVLKRKDNPFSTSIGADLLGKQIPLQVVFSTNVGGYMEHLKFQGYAEIKLDNGLYYVSVPKEELATIYVGKYTISGNVYASLWKEKDNYTPLSGTDQKVGYLILKP